MRHAHVGSILHALRPYDLAVGSRVVCIPMRLPTLLVCLVATACAKTPKERCAAHDLEGCEPACNVDVHECVGPAMGMLGGDTPRAIRMLDRACAASYIEACATLGDQYL